MASIQGRTDEKIFMALEWKGLHEAPSGDSKLDLGEAAAMRNFQVTRDGNMRKRPGLDMVAGLGDYVVSFGAEETARVDTHVCSQLTMHQTISVDGNGFLTVSGAQAVVSADNWETYVGYFWAYNKYYTWKLVRVEYDRQADTYTWIMRRASAVLDSASLYINDSVTGLWSGNVNGYEYVMAAWRGDLYRLYKSGTGWVKVFIGHIDQGFHEEQQYATMFGFDRKLYILGYGAYLEWDGTTLKEVEGYRPLVSVSIAGTSGGTLLEEINKLNGLRRVWISSDGTATTFAMPEQGLASVDKVFLREAPDTPLVVNTDYTVNLTDGTVTFTTAPVAGVNSYEIWYSVSETGRASVEKMQFCEFFNGQNDNRLFLYGDGSNQAIYSGLDYDGNPRADYFPDTNILSVGDANTPITGMIRHFSRLLVYKSRSAYSVQYSITTLPDNTTTAAFYVVSLNREIGNSAPGQVRLVNNYPLALHGDDLYEWKNNASYVSNLTADERQAQRISDRIYNTLRAFRAKQCYCYDNNDSQEYYICNRDGEALVWNYAADAWFFYDHFPAQCMCSFNGDLYVGDDEGRVHRLDEFVRSDNGTPFRCYWESGSMAFNREYMRKYSAMLWVGLKPENKAQVTVTVQTDRKSLHSEKIAASSMMTFSGADFRHWSFNTNSKPHEKRLKIKAKKFVFYKLLFSQESADLTATILNAEMRIRYTGYTR